MNQSTKGYKKFENEVNKEEQLTTTINEIGSDKNVNDAIRIAKQAAHRAYKIFVEKSTELNKNSNMTESEKTAKMTELLQELNSNYGKIKSAIRSVLVDNFEKLNKFQQKRLSKLIRKVQDAENKVNFITGESPNPNNNYEKINAVGQGNFKAKDFRVFEESPFKKLKDNIQKAAKNLQMKKKKGLIEPR